jgi:type III secretory pathway component EscS
MTHDQLILFLAVFLGAVIVGFLVGLTIGLCWLLRPDDTTNYQSPTIRENLRRLK